MSGDGVNLRAVLTRRVVLVMGGALAGLVLSKGIVLTPGFGIDDYGAMQGPFANSDFFISQGRFTYVALTGLLDALDLTVMQLYWPAAVLLLVLAAFTTALGLEHVTRQRGSVWMLAAIGAVVGAYPYFTEYFAFRSALVATTVSYVLLSAAVLILALLGSEGSWSQTGSLAAQVVMILTLLAATGLIQLSLVIFASFVLGRIALDAVSEPSGFTVRESISRNRHGILAVVATAPLYLATVLVTQRVASVEMVERGQMISLSEVPERARMMLDLTLGILLRDEVVLSRGVKFVLLAALVLMGSSLARQSWRRLAVTLLLALVLISASLFTVAVGQTWWPVPRSMYPLGIAYGVVGAVMVSWLYRIMWLPLTLLVVGALGSASHSSAILADQLRMNRWDESSAEMLGRHLLTSGVVTPDTPVVLVGPPYSYPVGIDTLFGDVNVSALAVAWGADGLLEEATGYKWNVSIAPTTEYECSPEKIWPNPDSVTAGPDQVVVCMSPSP